MTNKLSIYERPDIKNVMLEGTRALLAVSANSELAGVEEEIISVTF